MQYKVESCGDGEIPTVVKYKAYTNRSYIKVGVADTINLSREVIG